MVINGIIIRVLCRKERDAIISILTKKGIIHFFACDVFKIDSSNIILNSRLLYAKFVFLNSEKNLIFKEFYPITNCFYYSQFIKLVAINFISDIINYFFKNDMILIYDYLLETISLINDQKINDQKILNLITAFLAIALRLSGFSLNVENYCVISKNEIKCYDIAGISFFDGGFISKKQFDYNKHKFYSPIKCKILKFLFKMKIDDLKVINFSKNEIIEILNDLISYSYFQTDTHFRNEKFIKDFFIKNKYEYE